MARRIDLGALMFSDEIGHDLAGMDSRIGATTGSQAGTVITAPRSATASAASSVTRGDDAGAAGFGFQQITDRFAEMLIPQSSATTGRPSSISAIGPCFISPSRRSLQHGYS